MTDLSSLIARLEKVEGSSHELDRLIASVVLGRSVGVSKWTASVDAAVSLAERVLPGHQINVTKITSTMARASIGNGWLAATDHKTPALALVLATLRALQQKGSSNG